MKSILLLIFMAIASNAVATDKFRIFEKDIRWGIGTDRDQSIIFETAIASKPQIDYLSSTDEFSLNKDTKVTGNKLTLGDGIDSNKEIVVNTPGVNPRLVWDDASQDWLFITKTATKSLSSLEASEPNQLANLGLDVTVTASTAVITLTQSDGSTAPTVASPVSVGFRNVTGPTGGFIQRTATASISVTIPQGATLDTVASKVDRVHVYLIDNAGTIELAVSNKHLPEEGQLISTTTISSAADVMDTLFSTTGRANVPIRLVGFFESNQVVAGDWDTTPSTVYSGSEIESDVFEGSCKITNSGTPTKDPASGLCDLYIASLTDNGVGDVSGNFITDKYIRDPICWCKTVGGDANCSMLSDPSVTSYRYSTEDLAGTNFDLTGLSGCRGFQW